MSAQYLYVTALYAVRPGGRENIFMPAAFWASSKTMALGIAQRAVLEGFPASAGWSHHLAPVDDTGIYEDNVDDPEAMVATLVKTIKKGITSLPPMTSSEIAAQVVADIVKAAKESSRATH